MEVVSGCLFPLLSKSRIKGDTRGQGDTVWQLWLMLISAMY
jgi:hypothetical protein